MSITAPILLLAFGLLLALEGLVLALAPSKVEEVLEFLRRLSVETRRNLGLGFLAAGMAVIWLAGIWAG